VHPGIFGAIAARLGIFPNEIRLSFLEFPELVPIHGKTGMRFNLRIMKTASTSITRRLIRPALLSALLLGSLLCAGCDRTDPNAAMAKHAVASSF